jgi:hypothetical protein
LIARTVHDNPTAACAEAVAMVEELEHMAGLPKITGT